MEKEKKSGFSVFCAVLLIFLVFADQLSKAAAVTRLKPVGQIPVIRNVLSLLYLENRGAAFGMLKERQWNFVLIAAGVLLFVLYFFIKLPARKKFRPLGICLVLIAAGAAGNLIDRVLRGYVIDFIYFELIDFPVFNVADICICVGIGCMILLMLTRYREDELL